MIKDRYLQVVDTTFYDHEWSYVVPKEQLIIIVPQTKDGRYVCIVQERPTFKSKVISPIMGTFVETDPLNLIDTAIKEVADETGYICADIRHMMTVARSPGLTTETAHIYKAIVENVPGKQNLHGAEKIEVITFESKDDIYNSILCKDLIIDSSFPYYLI